MQGFERSDRQLLDAAALAGHLVPAGSMFAFLAAHRAEVFPDAEYADLFSPPGVGRPSLPATQMAAVLTLQALHDYSDRETAEAVKFDVRWKAAIGAALDDPGFNPSSLVYWRNRIARSARPHRISDAVTKVVRETGVLRGRRRRAVDSTILADAVATQDTVTQLVSAIRKVARDERSWRALWAELRQGGGDVLPEEPPEVDFLSEMAIVVAMPTQSCVSKVTIQSVVRQGKGAVVNLLEAPAAPNCVCVVSQRPFHAVRLPRIEGDVRFAAKRGQTPCGPNRF